MTIKKPIILPTILLAPFMMMNSDLIASDVEAEEDRRPMSASAGFKRPAVLMEKASEARQRRSAALELFKSSPDKSTRISAARIAALQLKMAKKLEEEAREAAMLGKQQDSDATQRELNEEKRREAVKKQQAQRDAVKMSRLTKEQDNRSVAEQLQADLRAKKSQVGRTKKQSERKAELSRRRQTRDLLRSLVMPQLVLEEPTGDDNARAVVARKALVKDPGYPKNQGVDRFGRSLAG